MEMVIKNKFWQVDMHKNIINVQKITITFMEENIQEVVRIKMIL